MEGGEAPAPDWPSQAQGWSMMEGHGSGAKGGGLLFVWSNAVKCEPGFLPQWSMAVLRSKVK